MVQGAEEGEFTPLKMYFRFWSTAPGINPFASASRRKRANYRHENGNRERHPKAVHSSQALESLTLDSIPLQKKTLLRHSVSTLKVIVGSVPEDVKRGVRYSGRKQLYVEAWLPTYLISVSTSPNCQLFCARRLGVHPFTTSQGSPVAYRKIISRSKIQKKSTEKMFRSQP